METKATREVLLSWLGVKLSIEQAASLAVGASPVFGKRQPENYAGMLQALRQAIENKDIPVIEPISKESARYYASEYKEPKVEPDDIKAWLIKTGRTDAFFFLLPPDQWPLEKKTEPNEWPWGKHNTELLEELAAAGKEFWSAYDPKNMESAPMNKVVESWLKDRGVSDRVATVMAQILRPKGLPTGPRKNNCRRP